MPNALLTQNRALMKELFGCNMPTFSYRAMSHCYPRCRVVYCTHSASSRRSVLYTSNTIVVVLCLHLFNSYASTKNQCSVHATVREIDKQTDTSCSRPHIAPHHVICRLARYHAGYIYHNVLL